MHYGVNSWTNVKPMTQSNTPKKKTPAKKAAASKKPAPKKAPEKKTPAKRGRPPKAKSVEEVLVNAAEEAVSPVLEEAESLLDNLIDDAVEMLEDATENVVIRANDIKKASLRKRVLAWFKRT